VIINGTYTDPAVSTGNPGKIKQFSRKNSCDERWYENRN
jgi:hypothetical protein